eukprot:gene17663-24011_t
MNHLLKLTSCFGRMDKTQPEPQPFSASMANLYDTFPLQVTIGKMPSPGTPFKVVFQNKASSAYFGPLECITLPLPPTLSEDFLWEQLLGAADSKGREELVSELVEVVHTGEEWRRAVPMVTLVTPLPVAKLPAVQTAPAFARSSCQLRLQTILHDSVDSPHPSATNSK